MDSCCAISWNTISIHKKHATWFLNFRQRSEPSNLLNRQVNDEWSLCNLWKSGLFDFRHRLASLSLWALKCALVWSTRASTMLHNFNVLCVWVMLWTCVYVYRLWSIKIMFLKLMWKGSVAYFFLQNLEAFRCWNECFEGQVKFGICFILPCGKGWSTSFKLGLIYHWAHQSLPVVQYRCLSSAFYCDYLSISEGQGLLRLGPCNISTILLRSPKTIAIR